jgi:dihydroorotate dehydrogenase electron transfer subunit
MADRLAEQGVVVGNRALVENYVYLNIKGPQIAAAVQPGQYAFIRCTGSTDPFLRRPISICHVNREEGTIGLLVKVVGKGTGIISRYRAGDSVDMMGPIGTPFPLLEGSRPLLVAGGIGIAPLMLLAEELAANGIKAVTLYSAASEKSLFFRQRLRRVSELKVATEDGSIGIKGTAIDLLEEEIAAKRYSHIYTCGPKAMMAKVQKIAIKNGIDGFVSLEERLACGIGACSGCAFPIRTGENGKQEYKKVCVDGPVFALEEVVFDGQD